MMNIKKIMVGTIVASAAMLLIQDSIAVESVSGCGSLKNHFGPFDYTDPRMNDNLRLVEVYHFDGVYEQALLLTNEGRESVLKGLTPRNIVAELDYTLRAFPNHHHALYAMSMFLYYLKQNAYHKYTEIMQKYRTSDCYYQRAVRFKSDDNGVYTSWGVYLYRTGEIEQAIDKLKKSIELQPKNADAYYTLGLIHLKKKDYIKAEQYAKKAYSQNYPLPYLRDKLKELGVWKN